MSNTPSPQPSDKATKQMTKSASGQVTANPSRGEGVASELRNESMNHGLPSHTAIEETTNIPANKIPPLPLRERVGGGGLCGH